MLQLRANLIYICITSNQTSQIYTVRAPPHLTKNKNNLGRKRKNLDCKLVMGFNMLRKEARCELNLCLWFICSFDIGFHFVAQAVPELSK